MANLPRWINDSTVDSSAMMCAYQRWVQQKGVTVGPLHGVVGPLPVIEHRSPQTVHLAGCRITPKLIPTPGTYGVECQEDNCVRCLSGRGGYQFRWYCTEWHDDYVAWARAGAWTPTGPSPGPASGEQDHLWYMSSGDAPEVSPTSERRRKIIYGPFRTSGNIPDHW